MNGVFGTHSVARRVADAGSNGERFLMLSVGLASLVIDVIASVYSDPSKGGLW